MIDKPLVQILRHDRGLVLAAIAALTLLAWVYTVWWGAKMEMPVSLEGTIGPTIAPWSAGQFVLMWAMWAIMMAAMMLPSVTPMILIYTRVAQHALREGKPFASAAWFAGGYLLAWAVFAAAATLAQWALEQTALLSPMAMTVSEIFGGAVLVLAGLFQFTKWKNACLSQCQTPLVFIQQHGGFRQEFSGSILLGVRHGLYCVGCCWALMCLLFVAGIMNLVWIAGLSILVLLEKIVPSRFQLSRIVGVVLVVAGVWTLVYMSQPQTEGAFHLDILAALFGHSPSAETHQI